MALFAIASVGAFAQSGNYGGKWTLDKAKSTMDERGGVESITLAVTHSPETLTVATTTKRVQPQGAGAGGGRQGGMARGPGLMGGDGTVTYTLDGKEHSTSQESQMGTMETKVSAKSAGTGLELTSIRKMNSPAGEITLTTVENWSLSDEGQTLTVKREMDTPRGKLSSTMVFTRS